MLEYRQQLFFGYRSEILMAALCLVSAPLSELNQQIQQFLHPEEIQYWSSLAFEKRQHSYLLGRYAAKQAFAYLDHQSPSPEIHLKSGVFGQPVLYNPGNIKVQASLSHAVSMGAAIVFPESHPMGIDIEEIRKNNACIISTQLSNQEKKLIKDCHGVNNDALHTLFWTAKEALSKTLRTGITSPLEIFALKSFSRLEGYWVGEFENFAQYQFIAFLLNNTICTIVHPKQIELKIDIHQMATLFTARLNIENVLC